WSAITGLRARAIPASELLLFGHATLAGSSDAAAVVISRSGRTSEALRAAEWLQREKNIRTLGITCTAGQTLEQICTRTLVLPADEKSTVMTQSVTSMLLALQYAAAFLARNQPFVSALHTLPTQAEPVLAGLDPQIKKFVD